MQRGTARKRLKQYILRNSYIELGTKVLKIQAKVFEISKFMNSASKGVDNFSLKSLFLSFNRR